MYSERGGKLELTQIVGGHQRTVVCKGADHLYDKSSSAHCMATSANTEVSMFPQQSSVLFMNADDVLDNEGAAVVLGECTRLRRRDGCMRTGIMATNQMMRYQVVNLTETVTADA